LSPGRRFFVDGADAVVSDRQEKMMFRCGMKSSGPYSAALVAAAACAATIASVAQVQAAPFRWAPTQPDPVSFGRILQGSTPSTTLDLIRESNGTTTANLGYTAGLTGPASVTASGNSDPANPTVSLQNIAAGTGTTGAKSWIASITTNAGADASQTLTATVVANRVVTGSSVNFGSVIVGGSYGGTSNLSTTLDNNNATAVTVGTTTAADGNGVSITGGTGTSFNAVGSTGTRAFGGTASGAGAKSGSRTLTTTGEGLAGEAPVNVTISYTGSVLDHSNGSFTMPTDTDTIVLDFGVVSQFSVQSLPFSIRNLVTTASFTAGLDLDSILETDPDSVFSTNLVTFANLAAGGSNGYSVALDTTNLGTFGGSYVLTLSDENLPGATGGQLLTINVIGEVVPEPTSLGLIGAAAVMGLARRRRRSA
jgi:hypothetical protein